MFFGSNYELQNFELEVNGKRKSLHNKINHLLIFCFVPHELAAAFKMSVLCFANRRVKFRFGIDIHLPKNLVSSESASKAHEIGLQNLIRFFASCEESISNSVLPELLDGCQLEAFKRLAVPLEAKQIAYYKFLSFFGSLAKNEKTFSAKSTLSKLAFLVDGGDAALVLELFSFYTEGLIQEKELLFFAQNVEFASFTWQNVSLADVKLLLVRIFKKLFLSKCKKHIFEFKSFAKFARELVLHLPQSELGAGEFEFFFKLAMQKQFSVDFLPKLLKFSRIHFAKEELELVYSSIFQKDFQLLIDFAFKLLSLESRNACQSQSPSIENKNRDKALPIFRIFFMNHLNLKSKIIDLPLERFMLFNSEVLDFFLNDELGRISGLRLLGATNSYNFKNKFKRVLTSKFLQKQLECEVRSGDSMQLPLSQKVQALVADRVLLFKLLRALTESPSSKGDSRLFEFFLEATIARFEKLFKQNDREALSDFQLRIRFLALIGKSSSAASKRRLEDLLLCDFGSHFGYEGKFDLFQIIFADQRKLTRSVLGSRVKADQESEAQVRILEKAQLKGADFDVRNEHFWDKLITLVKAEPRAEQLFAQSLGVLDEAFTYSLRRFQEQIHLLTTAFRSKWEQAFFEEQVDCFKQRLQTDLKKKPVFLCKNEGIPDLFKFLGVAGNPRLVTTVKRIFQCLMGKKLKAGARKKSPLEVFSKTKVVGFLENYSRQLGLANKTFYESSIVRGFSKKLGLLHFFPISSEHVNCQLHRLFETLEVLEKNPFFQQVVDFGRLRVEMKKLHEIVKVKPEKALQLSPFLTRVEGAKDLFLGARQKINANGLIYLLGQGTHLSTLERILPTEQLVQLKTSLGKWAEGEKERFLQQARAQEIVQEEDFLICEEQLEEVNAKDPQVKEVPAQCAPPEPPFEEYPKVPIETVIESLQDNVAFLSKLEKLHSSLFNKFKTWVFNKESQVSFSRLSFLMLDLTPKDLTIPFLKQVFRQVTFLRNSESFCETLSTLCNFFDFRNKAELQEHYGDFLRATRELRKDDFGSILKSAKEVPRIFFEVSSQPNSFFRLLDSLAAQKQSRSRR